MKSQYLVDCSTFELPAIDAEITAYVQAQESYWAETDYRVGIMHNGVIYRLIICDEDLPELIAFTQWIVPQGYTDIVGERGIMNGYSSIFVPNSDLTSVKR